MMRAPSSSFVKVSIQVGHRANAARIDYYIRTRIGSYSRTQIKKAIIEGRVFLNGQRVSKPSTRVFVNDQILYCAPPPLPRYIPKFLDIKILYEDDYILAVHKPSGMSMHPGPGHKGDTLADGLVYHYLQQGASEDINPGTVHRLDMPTSGLVIAGKDQEGTHKLSEQFANRSVQKEYLALVWGIPNPSEGWIDNPLEKSPSDRFRQMVSPRGKPSETHYETLETFPQFSLVKATPKTGRTHQIRVHLMHLGHPILGDPLYGKENFHLLQNQIPDLVPPLRLCLHHHALTFTHPYSKDRMSLRAPLPEDFLEIIERIRDFKFEIK